MAGSSNFQLFNSTQANQEGDAVYTSDSQRTGGLGRGSIVPSLFLNKILYQAIAVIYALTQALALKGFDLFDYDINGLITVFGNILTTKDQLGEISVVPFSATPVFNSSVSNTFEITLTGNVTSSTLTNVSPGTRLTFMVVNPSGFSFAWPTNMAGTGTVTTGTNIQEFKVRSDSSVHVVTPLAVS